MEPRGAVKGSPKDPGSIAPMTPVQTGGGEQIKAMCVGGKDE